MNTTGSNTPRYVYKEESNLLTMRVLNGHTAELPKGAVVKLNTDGEAVPVSALTDKPFGVVVSGGAADAEVTVTTAFQSIATAINRHGSALAVNDHLHFTGLDATTGLPEVVKAAVGTAGYVYGVALAAAADDANVKIGILRAPYYLEVAPT